MWERVRVDGKRKLKPNAIPTIFGNQVTTKTLKPTVATKKLTVCKVDQIEFNLSKNNIATEMQADVTSKVGETDSDETSSKGDDEKYQILTDSIRYQVSDNSETPNVEEDNRYKKLEKLWLKSERLRKQMKNKLRAARTEIKRLRSINVRTDACRMLFNEDQVKLLRNEYQKLPRWCNASLLKASQLKFACGTSGYQELLKQKFPLPSLRTLSRKLEGLKLQPGVCKEVFEFLRIKMSQFEKDVDRDYSLILDEMSITPRRVYCTSTNSFFSDVTLPNHTGIVTHALVFMLAGTASRWKQTVAYEYTGDSIQGAQLKEIVIEIIQRSEEVGLRVHAVMSDMGSANQSMWRAFGILVLRYSTIKNSQEHPCDKNRRLYFFADAVHSFKNIKAGLLNNRVFTIPQDIVAKYELPTDKVVSAHLSDLASFQKDSDFKLAPKLNDENLNLNCHFKKMRVSNSSHVLSHEVSAGLEYLSEETSNDSYITTAWFVEQISRWFDLMSSRNPGVALGKLKPEKYTETIEFLKEIIKLFTGLKVGKSGVWKPFQTAVLLSTKSLIQCSSYLLEERHLQFVLASRFTQDCLENVFSVVRMKNVIPNTLQFKNNLKLISICQYMKNVSNCSYSEDDRQFLGEFLDVLIRNRSSITNIVKKDRLIRILDCPITILASKTKYRIWQTPKFISQKLITIVYIILPVIL